MCVCVFLLSYSHLTANELSCRHFIKIKRIETRTIVNTYWYIQSSIQNNCFADKSTHRSFIRPNRCSKWEWKSNQMSQELCWCFLWIFFLLLILTEEHFRSGFDFAGFVDLAQSLFPIKFHSKHMYAYCLLFALQSSFYCLLPLWWNRKRVASCSFLCDCCSMCIFSFCVFVTSLSLSLVSFFHAFTIILKSSKHFVEIAVWLICFVSFRSSLVSFIIITIFIKAATMTAATVVAMTMFQAFVNILLKLFEFFFFFLSAIYII